MVEWVSTFAVSLPSSSAEMSAPAVRGHDDEVAAERMRGVDDGAIRLVVDLADCLARHARRLAGHLHLFDRPLRQARDSLLVFLLSIGIEHRVHGRRRW